MEPIKISVIIPVKPDGTVQALVSLREAAFPIEFFEVLVSEGCRPSRQRNAAAAQATGNVICFLDDDSLTDNHFLQKLAHHYQKNSAVAAVGGPSLTPETDTLLQKSFGRVLESAFGGGGNRNRYRRTGQVRETDDSELILCNLSFRRDIFLQYGGLDERLYPNEENELLYRLAKDGMMLVHDPSLFVFRSQRSSYNAFVRQIFGYGRGRAEQFHISKQIKIFTLLPSLFIVYLLLLPVFKGTAYVLPLFVYLATAMIFSLMEVGKSGWLIGVLCTVLFPTLHISYGSGFVAGLLTPRFRRGALP